MDILDALLYRLTSSTGETRSAAASELTDAVSGQLKELSSDNQAKLWNLLQPKLLELLHSQDTALGALAAIDTLLTLEADQSLDSKGLLFRFYNNIKALLGMSHRHDRWHIMTQAATVLGRVVRRGGAAFGDGFMYLEVTAALDLLSASDSRRYAAVLILKELAANSDQTHFHPHVGLVLEAIFDPLCDPHLIIRETTSALLAPCLDIIVARDAHYTENIYLHTLLRDAQRGMRQPQPECVHGSLLGYHNLLVHGELVTNMVLTSPSFMFTLPSLYETALCPPQRKSFNSGRTRISLSAGQ